MSLHATNAYDLLEDVKQVITDDPRRYNQGTWVETINPTLLKAENDLGNPIVDELDSYVVDFLKSEAKMPECGTIGCVAGWVWTMKATKKSSHSPIPKPPSSITSMIS